MIFEKVRDALADQLAIDPESITADTDILADLGADSLDISELMMNMEEELGIVIIDDAVHGMTTVGDVVAYLESTVHG